MPARAQGTLVALCPDIGEKPSVFTTRDGGGGLAQRLARAGYVVELVDPWAGEQTTGGFDRVLDEVYPALLAAVAVDDHEVIWIGRGVCGLLPVAAAATTGDAGVDGWVSLGTRFDYRFAPPTHEQWLRAWADGGTPEPDVERRTLLTGLAGSRRERRRGSTLDDVQPLWRDRIARPPPPAVAQDVLRWYELGACERRSDGLDYLDGLDVTGARALLVAAVTDPVAPPEDVLPALQRATGDVSYRLLSRVNGHGEEFGHVGMMTSRAARRGVDPVVAAWLAGRRRLP